MGRTSDARERLIETAKTKFYASSYHALGVNEICRAAGVNKGSFYHFFETKRDLVLAVIDEHSCALQAWFDQTRASKGTLTEKVQRILSLCTQELQESQRDDQGVKGCPCGNLALELSTQDERVRLKLQEVFSRFEQGFEAMLRDAANAGEVIVDDPRKTARSLVAVLEGLMLMAKVQDDPTVLRQHESVVTGLLAGSERAMPNSN